MNTTVAADRWITTFRPNSLARLRLFCLPAAGGNASAFQEWVNLFPEDIDICAVQLPGRQQRAAERPYTRMSLAVQALEQAIRPYLDLPFAIFGTCTGSLVGFELAQRLRRTLDIQPSHFFASCCRAPHLPDRDLPIHALPGDRLWAEIERLGGTPAIVTAHPEMRSVLSPVLRADFELAETYLYRGSRPLDCPLTVFGGIQDTIVSSDELAAWRDHTTGAFQTLMVNGGHYLIDSAREELVRAIATRCA
ncbi:thioesterase II family protein [Bradyrhizobium sp. USDA 10063]